MSSFAVESDAEWLSTMNELGPACMKLLAVWADMEGEEEQTSTKVRTSSTA